MRASSPPRRRRAPDWSTCRHPCNSAAEQCRPMIPGSDELAAAPCASAMPFFCAAACETMMRCRVGIDRGGVHLRGRPVRLAVAREQCSEPLGRGTVDAVVGGERRVPDDLPRGDRAVLGGGVDLLRSLLAEVGLAHRRCAGEEAGKVPEEVELDDACAGSGRSPARIRRTSRPRFRRSCRRERARRCPARRGHGKSRSTTRGSRCRRRRERAHGPAPPHKAKARARWRWGKPSRRWRRGLNPDYRQAARAAACMPWRPRAGLRWPWRQEQVRWPSESCGGASRDLGTESVRVFSLMFA